MVFIILKLNLNCIKKTYFSLYFVCINIMQYFLVNFFKFYLIFNFISCCYITFDKSLTVNYFSEVILKKIKIVNCSVYSFNLYLQLL